MQEIFSQGAEVVGAGADLLKSEYEKYEEGRILDTHYLIPCTIKNVSLDFAGHP